MPKRFLIYDNMLVRNLPKNSAWKKSSKGRAGAGPLSLISVWMVESLAYSELSSFEEPMTVEFNLSPSKSAISSSENHRAEKIRWLASKGSRAPHVEVVFSIAQSCIWQRVFPGALAQEHWFWHHKVWRYTKWKEVWFYANSSNSASFFVEMQEALQILIFLEQEGRAWSHLLLSYQNRVPCDGITVCEDSILWDILSCQPLVRYLYSINFNFLIKVNKTTCSRFISWNEQLFSPFAIIAS